MTIRKTKVARDIDKRRKRAASEKRDLGTYGVDGALYAAILAEQGGACAICQRAKGLSARLHKDHDHKCCPGAESCGRCIRGLLCARCNQLLGHLRDDPAALDRAADYLRDPPAQRAIKAEAQKILDRIKAGKK